MGHIRIQQSAGLPGCFAFPAQLRGADGKQTAAEAAAVGIHDMNVAVRIFLFQLMLGVHGCLIGAADAGGHGNIYHVLSGLHSFPEMLQEQVGIEQAGGDSGTAAQRIIIVVDIKAVYVALIFLLYPVNTIAAGQQGDAFQTILRQVGAAVRKYDKSHLSSLRFL